MKTHHTPLRNPADEIVVEGGNAPAPLSIENIFQPPAPTPGSAPEPVVTPPAAGDQKKEPEVNADAGKAKGDPSFDAFDAWMKESYKEAPEAIKNLDNWKATRELNSKLARDYGTLSVQHARAVKELEDARKAGGSALPEAEAVKALSAELTTLRTTAEAELAELRPLKARFDLEHNPAFAQAFDGKRAGLLASANEIVTEAGLDASLVDAVFGAKTEYGLARALAEIEDPAAKALLSEKAREFMSLTKERDAQVKNPLEALKTWRGKEEAIIGDAAKGFTAAFGNQLLAAIPVVQDSLKGDPFLSTPAGAQQYARYVDMFKAGEVPDAAALVRGLVLAEGAEVYRHTATKLMETISARDTRIAELEKSLSTYIKIDPGLSGGGGGGGGNGAILKASGYNPEKPLGR